MRQRKFFLAGGLIVPTIAATMLLPASFPADSSVRAVQDIPKQTKKWQALVPIDAVGEPLDTHKRTLRRDKNRRYNSSRSDEILSEQPSDVIYGRIDESPRPSPLPILESDAIVLGTVIAVQPFLTENKKSIYTEFTVRVEEAFKSELLASMTNANTIIVDQEGGALRQTDGSILRYFVGGTGNLPVLNGRYVLFLSMIHNHQDISILTGFELRNGAVNSLEEARGNPYSGWDEPRFLGMLRNAVQQGFNPN